MGTLLHRCSSPIRTLVRRPPVLVITEPDSVTEGLRDAGVHPVQAVDVHERHEDDDQQPPCVVVDLRDDVEVVERALSVAEEFVDQLPFGEFTVTPVLRTGPLNGFRRRIHDEAPDPTVHIDSSASDVFP